MARILIIDDDEAVRKSTTLMLEARGFDAVAVGDGQAGVDAIEAGAVATLYKPYRPNELVQVISDAIGADGMPLTSSSPRA